MDSGKNPLIFATALSTKSRASSIGPVILLLMSSNSERTSSASPWKPSASMMSATTPPTNSTACGNISAKPSNTACPTDNAKPIQSVSAKKFQMSSTTAGMIAPAASMSAPPRATINSPAFAISSIPPSESCPNPDANSRIASAADCAISGSFSMTPVINPRIISPPFEIISGT